MTEIMTEHITDPELTQERALRKRGLLGILGGVMLSTGGIMMVEGLAHHNMGLFLAGTIDAIAGGAIGLEIALDD